MDMKQLRTFVTLAQTLNYQKAAQRLQYAPSTLFKHIQLLEQELGVVLFVKAGRQIELTAEGQAFITHAEQMLRLYNEARDSVTQSAALETAITIGGCEINTGNSLLPLLNQFCSSYPRTRMSMLTLPNSNVPALAKDGLIDMGYYYALDERELPGVRMQALYQERIWLMAAAGHPLAQRSGLHYENLEGVPFAYPHDTCCFVTELFSRLRERGVRLGERAYLGSVHLVIGQVQRCGALTLVPQRAVRRFCSQFDMVCLDMDEEPILAYETIVYRHYDALSPIAKALVRESVSYAQENPA